MAKSSFIRCDHWLLQANPHVVDASRQTILQYRRMVNALCTVFLIHWPTVSNQRVQDLERLFHSTTKNPTTPYGQWFEKNFSHFPSYLRRAAAMAAFGAVSSFQTRYRAWQGGDRARRDARPPTWGDFMAIQFSTQPKVDAGP